MTSARLGGSFYAATSMTDGDETVKAHWALFPFIFLKRSLIATYQRYSRLGVRGKAVVLLLLLFYLALGITFFAVGPAKVTQKMYDLAQEVRAMRFGWLILGSIMVVASHPPMIGFTSLTMLCGFAWRLQGFYLAGPATVIGSAVAFILMRLMFKRRLKSWTGKSPKWQALEAVIRAKGLPLVVLIRLCPIPWVYSNAFFASVEAVSLHQFVIATVALLPKIFLQVFVGSRIADLADGEHRQKMDTTTKLIDIGSGVAAVILGILTGIYVYRITQMHIQSMEEMPPGMRGLAEDAVEDLEQAPLLRALSDGDISS